MPNLFHDLPSAASSEIFETLLLRDGVKIERIVSGGHASEPGVWFDQDDDEWVVLLRGTASLQYASGETVVLEAGDHLFLPTHTRHRVESTSADALWLAVHCRVDSA